MNPQNTGAAGARTIAPVYVVFEGELLLNAPLKNAWPQVINYPSWQNYSGVQRISGPPGQEGEVVLLKKEEEGFVFPPYYAITIKLEPQQRVIWKIYPEKGQEIDFFGIVEFKVAEVGNKTRFSYDTLYEFQVPYKDEGELVTFRKQQYENFSALFAAVFPKLEKLVASAA